MIFKSFRVAGVIANDTIIAHTECDYKFSDKIKYYNGYESAKTNQKKEGTKVKELRDLAASIKDFTETDIVTRNARIIHGFIAYMDRNGLLKKNKIKSSH